MVNQTDDRELKAAEWFHLAPYNWNCAQAIHKVAQGYTGLSDEEIELRYRSKGGGRAEGGLCGAIYAVRSILGENTPEAERLTHLFADRASGMTCRELKGKFGRPCSELVALAEELLKEVQQEGSN